MSLDSTPISGAKDFKTAIKMLFSLYFQMNIKYPTNIGNTLEFFQR